MPTMPDVVGLNLSEAIQALEAADVVNTNTLGYFGTWPVLVEWLVSTSPPETVTAQEPAPTTAIDENADVVLTVSNPVVSVAYP